MITLTREEAQHVLDFIDSVTEGEWPKHDFTRDDLVQMLQGKLSELKLKDDGYCQTCQGNHCTAKTGCVAISNPQQSKWEPLVERQYSPDGLLLSEKVKYAPDGEWKDLKQQPVAWWHDMGDVVDLNVSGRGTPLYFSPPQRKEWVGLTEDEIQPESLLNSVHCSCGASWTFKNGALDYKPSTKKKEWVGLTYEDKSIAFDSMRFLDDYETYAEVIEAKLKEKNT